MSRPGALRREHRGVRGAWRGDGCVASCWRAVTRLSVVAARDTLRQRLRARQA